MKMIFVAWKLGKIKEHRRGQGLFSPERLQEQRLHTRKSALGSNPREDDSFSSETTLDRRKRPQLLV
jgi:hypothetical protein